MPLGILKNTLAGTKAIATGMGITFKHYLEQQFKTEPVETVQYPE